MFVGRVGGREVEHDDPIGILGLSNQDMGIGRGLLGDREVESLLILSM